MTREDIDNIIRIICPNDEDFEKPIISPAYLKKELEVLALEEEPCDKYIKEIDHLRKYISKLETQIVEQEPSGDVINRQAVKDWFCTNYCSEHNKCEHFEKGDCNAMIELFDISSVNPQARIEWDRKENE